jgi:hypothetical protein
MRHLWSFLAGVVAAPLCWVLITLGQDESTRTVNNWVTVGTFQAANLIEPAVYLAVAGVLLGLVGALRVSPLGPLVAGLLMVAPYVGLFVAPFAVRDRVPVGWKVLGDPLPLRQPIENGTLFLLGVLLLMATFSIQRWRRWPRPVAPVTAKKDDSDDHSPWADANPSNPWGVLGSPEPEQDTRPPSLGYPEPAGPAEPLPQRDEETRESPWAAPPRTTGRPTGQG